MQQVHKKILKNGLTILVKERNIIPKVSFQLWYNVGSKDESSNEKGIAHLIEHMIFKGTEKLSESDINTISYKISAYCNAFTSNDYTGYLFNVPAENWKHIMPIMADCMQNCTFKEDLLKSELKAVIQELKMYKDMYESDLVENIVCQLFPDHPYGHPIIGYKQDLWNLERENLLNFYKKHYIPNNATLVVVGSVDKDEIFAQAEKEFGHIQPNLNYKKKEFYHSKDIVNKSITMYRDISQETGIITWQVPGIKNNKSYATDLLSWILFSGKGSILYKKLIDELNLITRIDTFYYDLFDQALFGVYFKPKNSSDIPKIYEIILNTLENFVKSGITEEQLSRALKKCKAEQIGILENNEKQAYLIGKYFLALNDENFIYNYLQDVPKNIDKEIIEFAGKYLKKSLANFADLQKIQSIDKDLWAELQKKSDEEDFVILGRKERELEVEEPRAANLISPEKTKNFDFPREEIYELENGLKILSFNNPELKKIDMILDFKIKSYFDSEEKLGLCNLAFSLLSEETKNYSSEKLADLIESMGMELEVYPGQIKISCLSEDLEKSLDILKEILINFKITEKSLSKVKDEILSDIKEYWDEPSKYVTQFAKEKIYKNHAYSKFALGSQESLDKFSISELEECLRKNITSKDSLFTVVGDISHYNIKNICEKTFSELGNNKADDIEFTQLENVQQETYKSFSTKDQTVICYAGLSVDRKSSDYDKLLIFDQIFGGGILGSMNSKLFYLREQTGLFYSILGSVVYGCDNQPGMIIVKTSVSNDRIEEAQLAIENCINKSIEEITEEELQQAKDVITNSLVDNFASNKRICGTFIAKSRLNLNQDYYLTRAEEINKIDLQDVKTTVKKYLSTDKLIKFLIGRDQ